MKTNFKLLLLFIICSTKISAQNSAIILTPNYHTNINNQTNFYPLPIKTNPVSTHPDNGYYAAFKATKSQNIQVDENGKIMFFIIDGYVFDRKGRTLGRINLDSDGKCGETVVVPSPQSCYNTFFLLTTYTTSGGVIGGYASFDKIKIEYDAYDNLIPGSGLSSELEQVAFPSTYNADNYKIASLVGSLFTFGETSGGGGHGSFPLFAATKEISGAKRFVYVYNAPYVFRLKIQGNQLTYDNYALDIRTLYSNQAITAVTSRQEMELVTLANGNFRLALPVINLSGQRSGYTIIDMNGSTGSYVTSSKKTIEYDYGSTGNAVYIKGAEFSPDGSKLYLSHNSVTPFPSTLDVFDLGTLSRTAVSTIADFKDSQIESGKDGSNDILLIPSTSQLHKITNPNTTPSVLNYQTLSGYNATCNTYPTVCSDPRLNVRLMQDQIDGDDYALYGNNYYTIHSETVTGTTTWNSYPLNGATTILVNESLTIAAGASLTINNMILKFAPNARLIIENGSVNTSGAVTIKGGKLILNGTKLTVKEDDCSTTNMWRGVEVRGISTASQGTFTNSCQGILQMNSNSMIEHAIYGAITSKYNKTINSGGNAVFTNVSGFNGGIVQTFNSFFKNNHTDITLSNYTSPTASDNLSVFNNTDFRTSGALNDPTLIVQYHIYLSAVRGVYILGCDFANDNAASSVNSVQRGTGIFALNSSFYADKRCTTQTFPCTPTDPNKFDNLSAGIIAWGFYSSLPFRSQGNIFTNNMIGIGAQTTDGFIIYDNQFIVNRLNINQGSLSQTAGVHIIGSKGYTVEGNNFLYDVNSTIPIAQTNTYGVVVDNSGTGHNEIYRNFFDKLKIGGQSERINGQIYANPNNTKTEGLQWKCNSFKNSHLHDLSVVNGRIDYEQGYSIFASGTISDARLTAARNSFSLIAENPSLFHDIVMSQADQAIKYVHLADASHTPDSYSLNGTNPGVVPVLQTFNSYPVFSDEFTCPTIYGRKFKSVLNLLADWKTLRDDAQIAFENSDSTKNDYQELLSVYSYTSNEVNRLRNELVQANLTDSTENISDLISFLNTEQDLASKKILFDLYLSLKLTESAHDLLDTVDFNDEYRTLAEILINLPEISLIPNYLDENTSIRESLKQLSVQTNDILVAEKSKTLLKLGNIFPYHYEFIDISLTRSSDVNFKQEAEQTNEIIFDLYPNPTTKNIVLATTSKEKINAHVVVMDLTGKSVLTQKINRSEEFIHVHQLQSGMYIVNIFDENGEILEVKRFVKE